VERLEAQREALALLHVLQRLGSWQERARSISFIDEGYTASQLWKADWERFEGDRVSRIAQETIRELEPLQA
ncbi:MAG: hypothetical protein N2C14_17975, partial [Planctomycetales bacterium]